jgi:hypothetical protein
VRAASPYLAIMIALPSVGGYAGLNVACSCTAILGTYDQPGSSAFGPTYSSSL